MGWLTDSVKSKLAAPKTPQITDYVTPKGGWGKATAEAMQKAVDGAYQSASLGRITTTERDAIVSKVFNAAGTAIPKQDKTFGQHLKTAGGVLSGAVVGLVTGGASGAVSGFVSSAAAASNKSGGITPDALIDVSTPPIVHPDTAPRKTDFGDVHVSTDPLLIMFGWAVMLWIVFKKVLR